MELTCYLHPGWKPLIRPAEPTRDWMSETPESFAYRCLPLNIANAHGWEVLSPCGFEACWLGGSDTKDVVLKISGSVPLHLQPVSIFGQGVLTFHIQGLFRTEPGWNLWVGGSPNRGKDGIYPLTGVIETDWAPFTFTMNWRFTRPGQWVRFDELEPICFFFPVQRGYLDQVKPRMAPIGDDPELMAKFAAWNQARTDFHQRMAKAPPAAPADKWQKHYYRGTDVEGRPGAPDHQAKLRLAPFKED